MISRRNMDTHLYIDTEQMVWNDFEMKELYVT